jgi:hypothetical protein
MCINNEMEYSINNQIEHRCRKVNKCGTAKIYGCSVLFKYKETQICPFEWHYISTTIKQKHLNRIMAGTKKTEYKINNAFWLKRLHKYEGINYGCLAISFLCGRKNYKFNVKKVVFHASKRLIDGIEPLWGYWAIHLGGRI